MHKTKMNKDDKAVKCYTAVVDNIPLEVICEISLFPNGRSESKVEIQYGNEKHCYVNGQKVSGSLIKNEAVLNTLESLLPKNFKGYIEEFSLDNSKNGWKLVEKNVTNIVSLSRYERIINDTKFTVEYTLRVENNKLVPWVAITNGKIAKIYKNGKPVSEGIPEIKNEEVKKALKELPLEIASYIPGIW